MSIGCQNLGEIGDVRLLSELLNSVNDCAYYAFTVLVDHSPSLRRFMLVGDELAGYVTLALMIITLALLLRQGRKPGAFIVVAAFVAALAVVEALRMTVPADRPTVAAKLVGEDEMQRSFPARAVFLFTLAAMLLLWAAWPALRRWPARLSVTAIFTVLTLWVAISQLMLGLHFVTDVAAGLFGGLALALLATRLAAMTTVPSPNIPHP
jgi:membrane-associated phospholipid phosphatase